MLLYETRVTIHHECSWKGIDSGKVLPEFGRGHDNRIVDLVFRSKALYRVRRTLVLGYTDDLQPIPVFLLQSNQVRNLLSTWWAPRCPEIDEHHLSTPIGTGDFPMFKIIHSECLYLFWITEKTQCRRSACTVQLLTDSAR